MDAASSPHERVRRGIPRPAVLVVIGPSASGKSSVVRELHRRGLARVHPTWTTRPPRDDERNGSVEHRFVSEAVFDDLSARGFFLDSATPFGLPHRYGVPPVRASRTGPVDIVMLRAPFVRRFAELVGNHVVYQIEASADRSLDRLCRRGCAGAELAARVEDNPRELAAGRLVADRVFVNDGPLGSLMDAVAAAMRSDFPEGRREHRLRVAS